MRNDEWEALRGQEALREQLHAQYRALRSQQQPASGSLMDMMRGLGAFGSYGQAQPPPSKPKSPAEEPVKYPGPVVPPKESERPRFLADLLITASLLLALVLAVVVFLG